MTPIRVMSVDIAGAERAQWKLMEYQELSANTVAFISYRYKITINFHQALSAPAMSKGMSQVGVILFPSF